MSTTLETVTAFRVRYAETDAMGVVHHATYPIWFEMGRSDWMRELGFPYTEVEARGYYLMLSGLNVRYRMAARYDDELTLKTRMSEVKSRTAVFAYELWRGEDLLATGETHHICTDRTYRPARMPQELMDALK
ncbi:acyl-CoA thioesterase [Deinococcus ruber]|uniref:4-hydroxybenzoyl-CoA thioesterase n=1 Tax=Deinococcus ruber TaxID=1848197 RepID=A0A918BY53_9DEIO|nr:thioesterase family protein [Deinococcus ruber]GGQ96630.1 4-hydroxybenzoyl-CoA thioesterase [Deinococcus ruber]